MALAPVLLARLLAAAPETHAQVLGPNLLHNGTFDHDIAGWTYEGSQHGALAWDDQRGASSPGSLRPESTTGESGTYKAVSPCFEVEESDLTARAEARVRADGSRCRLAVRAYLSSFCQDLRGEYSHTQPFPEEWSLLSQGVAGPGRCHGHPELTCFRSAAVVLVSDGRTGCNFDDVELRITSVASIPSWTSKGLVLSIALLAVVGLLVLGARRG